MYLAVPGLRRCAQAFPRGREQGPSVPGTSLTVAAPPAAQQGLSACSLQQWQLAGSAAVVCGLVAPGHEGYSQSRDHTHDFCTGG